MAASIDGISYNKALSNSSNSNEALSLYVKYRGGVSALASGEYDEAKRRFDSESSGAFKKNRASLPPGSSNSAAAGITVAGGAISGLGSAFESTSRYGSISSKEDIKAGDILGGLFTSGFNPIKIATAALSNTLKQITDQLQLEAQLRTDINEKTGLADELSKAYRQTIVNTLPSVTRLGYGIDDLTNLQENLMSKSGRFNLLSQETMVKSAETARSFVGSLSDMGNVFNEFETVGIGASKALIDINKAGKGSLELGLNSRQTVKDIRDNIGKLNEYGFQKGIQGLAEMSRKAKEFRMDMGEVFKIADKVMSPEGAIDLAANLQVLGGAIGDFGDPLKMLYDSTNNVEGLQDALIGAAGSLATYNSEQGRFEITGVNLRRAKEMANQLGISYQELAKGAIASQERMMASSALMAKGLSLPEKDKEFITNLSRMEGGQMVISIPESLSDKFQGKMQLTLDELTAQQIEVLKDNRKQLEKMSPEEIARDQFESVQNIERDLKSYILSQRVGLTRESRGQLGIDQNLKEVERAFKIEVDRATMGSGGTVLPKEKFNELLKDFKGSVVGSGFTAGLETLRTSLQEVLKTPPASQTNQTSNTPGVTNTTNLNITSDVTTDIISRNLLRSDQVWQDIFTRNPRDYTTLGL